jgi:energy-coupling factor transport system substrate-specific component
MKLKIKEIALFGMLGALMFSSKLLTEILPNIHLLGMFTVAFTVVFRKKALYPIYTFVLISGVFYGFAMWWIPYLYIWTVLWGGVMLIPKKLLQKIKPIVYAVVCSLHGFLYGVLYAPAQALFFGLDFKGTIAWIIAGFPFDIIHGISNLLCGVLIVPIIKVLSKTKNGL